jgi:hypothetical protein
VPFLQRENLHGYMDVDGDGTIDLEEFATAIFGRAPPSLDKSFISLLVEQVDIDTQLVHTTMKECTCVSASVDFLSHHRAGLKQQAVMMQQASPARPLQDGCVLLNHQQRLCVDLVTHPQHRHEVFVRYIPATLQLRCDSASGRGVGACRVHACLLVCMTCASVARFRAPTGQRTPCSAH